jgi:imidazolonepropionase-like amidohydrolase
MPHSRTALLTPFVVVAATVVAIGQAGNSRVTVYQGARLITGTGAAAVENATIVVEGGRFAQAGPASAVKVPPGAARVDLAGKTVIPAIIDAHVHLSDNREALIAVLQRRAYYGV